MDEERTTSERLRLGDRERNESPVIAYHDWDGTEGVAVTVAQTVAEAWTGDPNDALSLPPVGSVVDVDALQRLFVSLSREFVGGPNADGPEPATVRFEYVGYDVTVREDGFVLVEEVAQ